MNTKDYRFLTGRELVRSYAAPILYNPPAYHSTFCSNCGSPVPQPSPEQESFEIPAGAFDADFGIRPDKHIFVEFMPAWDDLGARLPAYTLPELYELRTGRKLPPDFQLRSHASLSQESNLHDSGTVDSAPKDFDFIIGNWRVNHRRLAARLCGCNEWVEFEGLSATRKVLGGFGNLEDNYLAFPKGPFRAVALRSFNSQSKQWAIWWLDGRNPGEIDKPVVGQFSGPTGVFFADDVLNGAPIKVRFIWSALKPDRPRWQQAFSADGGTTWETNWTMDFTRRE